MDDPSLQSRKALVTGASRGIGHAVAAALCRGGASVVITGRRAETLEAAAAAIDPTGQRVLTVVCHQGRVDDISRLFDWIDARWGRLDVAVVNAGTNPALASLVETEKSAWDKVIEVNLTGAFLVGQAAGRRMIEQRGGSIVFVSSIAAMDPMPGLGAYSASKAGLIGLAKAFAKELAPSGVRVNVVAPGVIETHLSKALIDDPATHARLLAQIPLGRHGQPDDVVGAVMYLASESARFVTGQVLVVDGGMRV